VGTRRERKKLDSSETYRIEKSFKDMVVLDRNFKKEGNESASMRKGDFRGRGERRTVHRAMGRVCRFLQTTRMRKTILAERQVKEGRRCKGNKIVGRRVKRTYTDEERTRDHKRWQ